MVNDTVKTGNAAGFEDNIIIKKRCDMKKKFRFPVATIVTAVLTALCLCVFKTIEILKDRNIYIYYKGVDSDKIIYIMQNTFMFFLAVTIISLMFLNIKYKWIPAVMSVCIILLTLFFITLNSFSNSADEKYYNFTSADGKHQIVVCEWSFLLGGGGGFYERTSDWTMEHIGGYFTDDGNQPIRQNDYRIEWRSDGFDFVIDSCM